MPLLIMYYMYVEIKTSIIHSISILSLRSNLAVALPSPGISLYEKIAMGIKSTKFST